MVALSPVSPTNAPDTNYNRINAAITEAAKVSNKQDAFDLANLLASVSARALQSDFADLTATVNGKASAAALTALQGTVAGKADQSALASLMTTVNSKANAADLTALAATVAGKASTATVTALQSVVAGKAAQADLDDFAATVASKANQSDLAALSAAVAAKASASSVTALTATANAKADQAVVNTLTESVASANQAIAGKAAQADLEALTQAVNAKASQSALSAEATARAQGDATNASAIAAEVTARQQAVANEAALRTQVDGAISANLTAVSNNLGAGIAAENSARAAAVASLTTAIRRGDDAQARAANRLGAYRPGETPEAFTRSLAGGASDVRPSLADAPVTTERGPVLRLTKADLIAGRHFVNVEPGRKYDARAVVQRRTIPDDPAGEAVRFAVAWFDQFGQRLTGGAASTTVEDVLDLRPTHGRREIAARLAKAAGQDVSLLVPSAAVFGLPYVQVFGGSQQTDVEVLDLRAADDGIAYSPDLVDLTQRVSAQEAIDAADRLDAVESAVAAPGAVRFRNLAEAQAADIPESVTRFETIGYSLPGIGGAAYVIATVPGPAPGKIQVDGRWWDIETTKLALEQLGARSDNPSASLAAVQGARRLTTLARLDTNLSGIATADLDSYMNLSLYGRGQIDLYRKHVSGDLAPPAMPHMAGDLSPLEHCPTSCRSTSVVEVLIGDSISSYQANTSARSGMLATVLERELRAQARAGGRTFTFHNRAIGGQSLTTLADKPITAADRVIAWYPDRTRRWLDVVKDLVPTRVFISMGMNDLATMSVTTLRNIISEIRGWGFGTDIVLLTNLIPRPYVGPLLPADGPWNDRATQEGADRAAGLVRTYAKRYGIGLLDMHRMCCRARDGFDPTEGTIRHTRDATPITNGAAGTRQVYGFAAHFVLDPTKLATDGSTPITINHGPGSSDVIQINRIATANTYQITLFSGDNGDQITVSGPTSVTIAPPADQAFELVFEKTGNLGLLYMAGLTATGGYGESNPNIWCQPLVSRGGLFQPTVTCTAAGALSGIGFDYMAPTIVRPTVDPTTLFGNGDGTYEGSRDGGSGYNHPSTYVEPHVYMPVLRGTRLYDGDAFRQNAARTLTVTDSGADRRFDFNADGFAARDGNVTSYGFFRSGGGIRFSLTNAAPRIYPSGSGVGIAAGGASDTAYYTFGGDGTLEVSNGRVKAQGLIGTQWPSSPDGLQPGEVWRDAAAGGVLKAV